jgi:hypothetical protein
MLKINREAATTLWTNLKCKNLKGMHKSRSTANYSKIRLRIQAISRRGRGYGFGPKIAGMPTRIRGIVWFLPGVLQGEMLLRHNTGTRP